MAKKVVRDGYEGDLEYYQKHKDRIDDDVAHAEYLKRKWAKSQGLRPDPDPHRILENRLKNPGGYEL